MNNVIPTFRPIRIPICSNRISLDYDLWDLSPESYKSETYAVVQGHGYLPIHNSNGHQVYHTNYELVKELNDKAKLYQKYKSLIYYGTLEDISIIREIENELINKYKLPIID